jgi:hypothetical protein
MGVELTRSEIEKIMVAGPLLPDRIDHCSLLANEQEAGAVERETALLVRRIGGDERHVDPGNRFADRLSVGGIVLARPVMRRSAGLDANQARRQLLKESQNVAPPQLTADNHLAFGIRAMDLKHRLGDVETDSRQCLHHFHGTLLPVEEAVHSIKSRPNERRNRRNPLAARLREARVPQASCGCFNFVSYLYIASGRGDYLWLHERPTE